MKHSYDAYLDIETTGLSTDRDLITVIGIYLVNEVEDRFIQLYGERVTPQNLLAALEGVDKIYTYNGRRFDLRFIDDFLGVDLTDKYEHEDLMDWCHDYLLYGGFKAVEKKLGISRETEGICGFHAVLLWDSYQKRDDMEALDLLLKYNKEDVVNLKALREKLEKMQDPE